ncbi:hypothetical protein [Mycobacterium sp. CnD-18-1]|uniref:hypothetical protein n=1 Tax=Mycobacterium sp. CnD-18-1 TaxID=2917744 RepID=UPI001EF29B36|nr:hypothetical protein [Mycobacterium sp. CnD-18-1]MCG7607132.1 hypothetical protein [Mycobacterium sp. CnD-18-1]
MPAWLTKLLVDTDGVIARALRGDPPPCDHETCAESNMGMCYGVVGAMLDSVKEDDRRKPDRICLYCFSPRNSEECNFAQGHPPYVEAFS